jgi:gas vesicle protein
MNRIFSFLLGGIAGGLVGAALALLLAPASGAETRNLLQTRAASFRDEVQSAAASRRIELEQQLAQLRSPRKPETPV